MSAAERKAELARKKAKLAAMREDRFKRDQSTSASSLIFEKPDSLLKSIFNNGCSNNNCISVEELLQSVTPAETMPK